MMASLLEIRGDELFVLFGTRTRSKHVWKAAQAALAISRAAAGLKEELSSAVPPLIMNMGINSGVASVGLHAVEACLGLSLALRRERHGGQHRGPRARTGARRQHPDERRLSRESAERLRLEDMGEHP